MSQRAPNPTRSRGTAAGAGEIPPLSRGDGRLDTGAALRRFRRDLLRWYDSVRRELPWRRTSDPFAVWVSEVMLQQTRVDVVVPRFEAFLRRFPDCEALARASEESVLAAWSGLGYYSRARNLHRGAKAVVGLHEGRFPKDLGPALAIPGVGAYTAAAVLSIAYGRPHAVVDGNVVRVLARLFRLEPPHDRNPRELGTLAGLLLDPRRPGDHNQAMMELGALVCAPRRPRCGECPVAAGCGALASGETERFPRPRSRPPVVDHEPWLFLIRDGRGRLLLGKGHWPLLDHLWLPPIAEEMGAAGSSSSAASDVAQGRALAVNERPDARPNRARSNRRRTGGVAAALWRALPDALARAVTPGSLREAGTITHSITRHRIRFRVVAGALRGTRKPLPEGFLLAGDEALEGLGRSSILEKALRLEAPDGAPEASGAKPRRPGRDGSFRNGTRR